MRCSGVAFLTLAAVLAASMTPANAGSLRSLLSNPVCSGLDLACSAACSASGYSYYSYNCGKNNCRCSNSASKCFPGSATVRLRGGERKPMAQLALGDEVLTVGHDGTLRYDKVYLFSSRRPHELASFVRIITAAANVTATHSHYLYVRRAGAALHSLPAGLASWELVPAGELRLGDAVLVAQEGSAGPAPAEVTGVEQVASDLGVYNPHTRAGAIVVDGIVASELTSFVPRWAAHPYLLRATAAALHAAFAVLPRNADALIATTLSSLAHGGPGDAIVDRTAFMHAPMSVLA